MQKNQKFKNNSIEKLCKILDNISIKDLPPEEEKYLRSLSEKLEKSYTETIVYKKVVSKENNGKKIVSLKPKVTIHAREVKKIIEFPEVKEEKTEVQIEKPFAEPPLPVKEPQYKGESGGGTMAKEVVGDVVGVPIEYHIAVDFDGFKKLTDALGGVDVEVPVSFDDYFYPIKGKENETCGKSASEIAKLHELYSDTQLHHQFECRYERIHFDKGKNHMDGETVLKFVRSRASVQHGGDFARSQRQQAVILAMKEKLFSLSAVKKFDDIYFEFTDNIDVNDALIKKEIIGFS